MRTTRDRAYEHTGMSAHEQTQMHETKKALCGMNGHPQKKKRVMTRIRTATTRKPIPIGARESKRTHTVTTRNLSISTYAIKNTHLRSTRRRELAF